MTGTLGRLTRIARLEARQVVRRGVVIVWPDGVRDGWGRPARVEGAAVVIRLPMRAVTAAEIEAARERA